MNAVKSLYGAAMGHHTRGQKSQLFPKYIIFTSGLIAMKILVVCFWARSKQEAIIWPVGFGVWLEENPKWGTQIFSFCGTVLSYSTFFLFDKLLHLMVRQKIQSTTSLSTIEGWSRLSYHKIFKETKRPYLAMFSLAIYAAATLLQSAFTTLITPVPLQQTMPISGREMNLKSDGFLQWIDDHKENITSCDWYTYTPQVNQSVYYPVCPSFKDQVAFTTSGMVNAVDQGAFSFSTFTRVADSIFNGSTGGVLPIGEVGIAAFLDDLPFPDVSVWLTTYDYSVIQQGVSLDVSCENTTTNSPISRGDPEETWDVTNSFLNATMAEYTFTYDESVCPGGSWRPEDYDTFVTLNDSAVGVYMCQENNQTNDWNLYLRPYNIYEELYPSYTCKMKPYLTNTLVTYRSDGYMIKQEPQEYIGDSTYVPFDIIYAIPQAFLSSYSSTGNFLLDSVTSASRTIYSLQGGVSNYSEDTTLLLENFLVGIFEYQATLSKIHYRALQGGENGNGSMNLDLSQELQGNFTIARIGYDGTASSIKVLFPVLSFLILSAFYYCFEGMRAEHKQACEWDPLNPVCLVVAGAAGGAAGRLGHLQGMGDADHTNEEVKRYEVRFVGEQGLVNDKAHGDVTIEQGVPEKESFLHNRM